MTKETVEKIIAHNRRPFAVHQIWAAFDQLERENAKKHAALTMAAATFDRMDTVQWGESSDWTRRSYADAAYKVRAALT